MPTSQGRALPLYDPQHQPPNWNERMQPGEVAVLFTGDRPALDGIDATTPACLVFPDQLAAEDFARQQVQQQPRLRCRLYSDSGLAAPPLATIAGTEAGTDGEMSARFRRITGVLLLTVGIILICIEIASGWQMNWPGMIGFRLAPLGLLLLVVETGLWLTRQQKARHGR